MKSFVTHSYMLATIALVGSSALARQQDSAPKREPPPAAAPDQSVDQGGEQDQIAQIRAMLDRRHARVQREIAHLADVRAMLDRGDSLEALRDKLREFGEASRANRAEAIEEFRDRPRAPGPRGPRGEPPAPRDGMGAPEPRGAPESAPLDPERALGLMGQLNPPLAERLRRLRRENPEDFRAMMERFAPRLAEFDREHRNRPEEWRQRAEIARLDREASQLARQIAQSFPEEQPEAVSQLRDIVTRQYDTRLRMREQEIAHLSHRIDEIRQQVGDAAKQRDEMVSRRVRQMIREAHEGQSEIGDDPEHRPEREGRGRPPFPPPGRPAPR